MGWIPKISIGSISCRSYQQRRPISSSRIHRISTKLGMQHHTYLLSLLIISFYILTTLLSCYMFSKGHVMLFFGHLYAYQTSEIFLQTKHLKFYFKKRNHFRDGMTRLVINTRLFTTLKIVAMLKIIEFYWFMHSALCGWMHFEKFHYTLFGRWFCSCMIFRHGRGYTALQTVSIYFLLFYHHNIMLKTDIMLDYW